MDNPTPESHPTPDAFNASAHLSKVNGNDYLEVKWRLVWLRSDQPGADITTELRHHDGAMAIFSAHVAIPGKGSATGWGSESANDFTDYIEKAETKALGRALAAMGCGTQFTVEFSDADSGRIADAPVNWSGSSNGNRRGGEPSPATPRQIKFLAAIAQEAGMTDEELLQESMDLFGTSIANLPRKDASLLIERLQARRTRQLNGEPEPDRPASAPQNAPASGQSTKAQEDEPIDQEEAKEIKALAEHAGWNAQQLTAALKKYGASRLGELTWKHSLALKWELEDIAKLKTGDPF